MGNFIAGNLNVALLLFVKNIKVSNTFTDLPDEGCLFLSLFYNG